MKIQFLEINKRAYKKFICFLLAALLLSCLCCGCGGTKEVMAESVTSTDSPQIDGENVLQDEPGEDVQGNEENAARTVSDNAMQSISEDSIQGQDAEIVTRREPVKVKGIYVSGPVAGIDRMDALIELIDRTELNAMVIDIKNDEGRVTYKMQSEQVLEIDAGVSYIKDIEELVSECKKKDIYLIARIVAFRDPYLAEQKPEWAVHTKDGDIFRDKSGLAWVNPYKREVWDYLAEIASQAADAGFDEVQFDYIRFSTDIMEEEVDYGPESESVGKIEIITEFTKYMYEKLVPQGVYVAADVFGTVIDNETDQEIVGQDYVKMAEYLDYICPMVYPSHYYSGSYGISIPDAEPYATIYAAASSSAQELQAVPEDDCARVRPWLQGFTASWVSGHINYGREQIRAQIKGAYDAGYDEWILWNAAVKYQPECFLTDAEAEAERQQWDLERQEGEKQPIQETGESGHKETESGENGQIEEPVKETEPQPVETVSGNE
ncbi:MAG: putative glycoside hydrolase [Lachnospiraceae bacterium]|nr:putative glycoside hydrolase [Lachnospiraceae bacterium]